MIENRDLDEIVGREISRVAINPNSVSVFFDNSDGRGGWLLVQCQFIFHVSGRDVIGKATVPESSAALLGCVGRRVINALFDKSKVLKIYFENEQSLRIVPEKDGLESYVLHTQQGIVPVIDF